MFPQETPCSRSKMGSGGSKVCRPWEARLQLRNEHCTLGIQGAAGKVTVRSLPRAPGSGTVLITHKPPHIPHKTVKFLIFCVCACVLGTCKRFPLRCLSICPTLPSLLSYRIFINGFHDFQLLPHSFCLIYQAKSFHFLTQPCVSFEPCALKPVAQRACIIPSISGMGGTARGGTSVFCFLWRHGTESNVLSQHTLQDPGMQGRESTLVIIS